MKFEQTEALIKFLITQCRINVSLHGQLVAIHSGQKDDNTLSSLRDIGDVLDRNIESMKSLVDSLLSEAKSDHDNK